MFCSECESVIEAGSRFCRHCGAVQPEKAEAADDIASESSSASLKPHASRWARGETQEGATNQSFEVPITQVSASSPIKEGGGAGAKIAAGLLVLVLVVVGLGSTDDQSTTNRSDTASDIIANSADTAALAGDNAATGLSVTPDPNWEYSTDEDKVRGRTAYFAQTTSTNSIHQDPPYDDQTTMQITVRKHPAYGTDVILTISSGQMMCPSYEGCKGTVRFDDGPSQKISLSGSADNSSETVFIDGAKSFIAKLKRARKLVIEKTLYEAGSPQFEFDVNGLKWSH